jgi:Na+/melibiose symporter-like transporter
MASENQKKDTLIAKHSIIAPEDRVPLKEKFLYGAADIFGGGQVTMLSLLLLVFFTDIIGIPAVYAGSIILISKLWDALSDPICGILSDNVRTRLGRRKPFMIAGGLLIPPALAMLFAPVQNLGDAAKVLYAAAAYVVYCTVSTISQVPYMSMSSDLSPDYRERNTANLIKLGFDMFTAAVCYLLPSRLFEMLREGRISQTTFYLVIVLGFGTFFAVPMVVAGFTIKERTPYAEGKSHFEMAQWLSSFKVKSFKYHIMMYIGAFLSTDIISNAALYYVANVLGGVQMFGKPIGTAFIIAPMMVVAGISIPIYYLVMRKTTKQFAFRLGIPVYIAGVVFLACFQKSWPTELILVASVLMGIGLGGAQMMPWIVFPDTVDVAEFKLGYRPTGNFSGMMTFLRKLSAAVAIQLFAAGLSAAGYQSSTADVVIIQPTSVVLAIRLMAISVALFLGMGFYASVRYKVTNKKLERIRYFCEMRRAGVELSAQEKEERQLLLKELA